MSLCCVSIYNSFFFSFLSCYLTMYNKYLWSDRWQYFSLKLVTSSICSKFYFFYLTSMKICFKCLDEIFVARNVKVLFILQVSPNFILNLFFLKKPLICLYYGGNLVPICLKGPIHLCWLVLLTCSVTQVRLIYINIYSLFDNSPLLSTEKTILNLNNYSLLYFLIRCD